MEYTKGEWKVENFGERVLDERGDTIAVMMKMMRAEALANAQLISAAPELYEAVKQALLDIDRTGYTKVHHIVELQNALAKAEGN